MSNDQIEAVITEGEQILELPDQLEASKYEGRWVEKVAALIESNGPTVHSAFIHAADGIGPTSGPTYGHAKARMEARIAFLREQLPAE